MKHRIRNSPDMFHDMSVHLSGPTICFTICLFISPDLDGHPIFLLACLFISPDLDGYNPEFPFRHFLDTTLAFNQTPH